MCKKEVYAIKNEEITKCGRWTKIARKLDQKWATLLVQLQRIFGQIEVKFLYKYDQNDVIGMIKSAAHFWSNFGALLGPLNSWWFLHSSIH